MHSRSQTADEIADNIDVRTGPQPLSYELQVGRKASVTNRLLALWLYIGRRVGLQKAVVKILYDSRAFIVTITNQNE